MALSITTELKTAYYTCDIPNVSVSTDRPSVLITIYVKNRSVFKSTYYASNGQVTIRDIASIIEAHYIQNGYSMQNVSIGANDGDEEDENGFVAIFCRFHCISKDAEAFLLENFFTTATSRVTTLDCPQYLHGYFPKGRHSVTVSAMVQLPNGTVQSKSYTESLNAVTTRMMTITIKPSELEEELCNVLRMDVKLLQFSYTIETRRCHFFIQRVPFARCFYFWNVFNCKEAIAFPSETITDLETDFSEAVVEHQLAHYDVEHSFSYETHTGELLLIQTRWLEQFFTSPKIQLAQLINGSYPLVLIIEYEHQISDAPGSSNAVNFKWKFADKRLTLNDFNLDDGIFTEQYTEEYV